MPVRTFRVLLSNNTEFPLIRADHHLCHGDWTSSDWEPPPTIPPRTEKGWQSESAGVATGTEGWVKYRIGIPPLVLPGGPPPEPVPTDFVYIYWDNPFAFGATKAKGSVTISDVTPDCDADGHDGGGSGFGDPKSGFELFETGFDNAGAAYKDGLNFVPQLPLAPIIIFGTVAIVPHALIHTSLRKRGSVKQSLPLGYDANRGLRTFKPDASPISVESLFHFK